MMEEVEEDDEKTIMFQSSMKKTGLKKECVIAGVNERWEELESDEFSMCPAPPPRFTAADAHCGRVRTTRYAVQRMGQQRAESIRRSLVILSFSEMQPAVTHANLRACEGVEVSGVQAGSQSAFAALMERVSAGRTMVRREEGPKQAVASLIASGEGSGPIYVLCFKNEGPHRINSHEGGWKNPEQCKDFTKGKPRLPDAAKGEVIFGLEWPEGQATAGQAQCMPIYTEQRIDELLKLGHAHESECRKESWHNNPLGGAHRLAVYVYVPG
ncbi:unnamed protein product [Symbiodinium necroappetens]|uniref:Uncharacterized protein n=1 Tax=Symbiodinium necroappetens TaxID=1628268 RepID=A0A812L5F7_9DINO|nr:unnamed protein product [Symbiodinium necroappetens]